MKVLLDEATYLSVWACRAGALARLGVTVDWSETAPRLYEKAKTDIPDVVVARSDIEGGGAARLFRTIRGRLNLNRVRLFALVSASERDRLDEYLDLGCDEIALLPVDPGYLVTRIVELHALKCRRTPRVSYTEEIPTRYDDEVIACHGRDISETGLSFVCSRCISDGAALEHTLFCRETGQRRSLLSRVVRGLYSRRAGVHEYGARFADLTAGDVHFIRSAMALSELVPDEISRQDAECFTMNS